MTPTSSTSPKNAWFVALSATNEAFFGLDRVEVGWTVSW
jgi:hypothetical protein